MMFGTNDAVEMKRDAYGIPAGTKGKVLAIVRRSKHAKAAERKPTLIVEFDRVVAERVNAVMMTVHETDLRESA